MGRRTRRLARHGKSPYPTVEDVAPLRTFAASNEREELQVWVARTTAAFYVAERQHAIAVAILAMGMTWAGVVVTITLTTDVLGASMLYLQGALSLCTILGGGVMVVASDAQARSALDFQHTAELHVARLDRKDSEQAHQELLAALRDVGRTNSQRWWQPRST